MNNLAVLNQIRLSIIVPTYNKCSYLPLLLDSLLNQKLDQKYWELVIVNDGSTDQTLDVLERYQDKFAHFRVISQPNRGIGAARNVGIRNSVGEFISFLADDYILSPDYCTELLPAFENPEVEGVRGLLGSVGNSIPEYMALQQIRLSMWVALEGNGVSIRNAYQGLAFPDSIVRLKGILSWSGGSMMRRSLFDRFGYFDEVLVTGEDTEFAHRLAFSADIRQHLIPKELLKVGFRKNFFEYCRRSYEYSRDSRKLIVRGQFFNKTNFFRICIGQVRSMLIVLLQMQDWKKAIQVFPFLVMSKFAVVLGYLRG